MAGIGGTGIAIESALMSSCRSVPIVRSCRINFGSFLDHFWDIFGTFCFIFESIFESFFDRFWVFLRSF